MTSTTSAAPAVMRPRQGGPPLIIPGLVVLVLSVVSAVLGASGPRPATSAADTLAYDLSHHTLLTWLGAIVFGVSIPLATWTATAYRRLRQLGITAPGTAIALSGGLLASGFLGISGLVIWTAGQSATAGEPGLARALTTLSFAAGGPGFVVPLALLLAGVAVPSLILRLMPRWVGWAGMVIAALAVLSTLSLLTSVLDPLLPVGRFGGLLWLVVVSIMLPISRQRRHQPQATHEPDLANA
jgi:hypothetical protein